MPPSQRRRPDQWLPSARPRAHGSTLAHTRQTPSCAQHRQATPRARPVFHSRNGLRAANERVHCSQAIELAEMGHRGLAISRRQRAALQRLDRFRNHKRRRPALRDERPSNDWLHLPRLPGKSRVWLNEGSPRLRQTECIAEAHVQSRHDVCCRHRSRATLSLSTADEHMACTANY